MPKLTLSMIVKNEEKYLRECLESVQGIVDEIVLVDTGSTDGTLNIARDFETKIYNFDWINDFSAARNFALSKSTGNWILYLDADERLECKSKNELLEIVQGENKIGVNCTINNIDEFRNNPKLMKYVRLFKNSDSIRFTGKAHEQIEPSLEQNNYEIKNSTIEIKHIGYNVSNDELKLKAQRNLDLMLSEYKTIPTSYLSFQIANSYSILEDDMNKLRFYNEALKDSFLRREYKSICYLHLADYEMRQKNFEKAKLLIDAGLKNDKNHTLLFMIAGQIYDKFNDSRLSLKYISEAFKKNLETQRQKQSNNSLDVIIDNKKILLEGIILSLKYSENKYLQNFLNSLKNENLDFYNNIYNLIINNISNDKEISDLCTIIDDNNIDQILKILKHNTNVESKLLVYSKLFDTFSTNQVFLNDFGTFLIGINQLEEAKLIFELAIQDDDFDDSAIFYLSSIYTSLGDFEALKKMLIFAEKHSHGNQLFKEKLNLLKKKVTPLLNI